MKFFAVLAALLAVGAAFPSSWTLEELSAALANPNTDPALIPYLESALNDLYAAVHSGQQVDSILVPVPAAIPNEPEVHEISPSPVAVLNPSPLVQVIVNVNKQQQQITEVPAPEVPAIIVPTPVDVVDNVPVDVIEPTPVIIVDNVPVDVIEPTPVIIVDNVPVDVIEPSPVDVVDVTPEVIPIPVDPGFNPIDTIAINPEPIGVLEVSPAGDFDPFV